MLQALATGAMLAGVAYVSRWVLVDKGAATILFVCFVGPALLLTPAWSALGQRIGKKQGYVAASLVLALAAVLLIWSRSAPDWWVYGATALVGLGYAGAQVFPMAMLPDAAAVDARRTGDEPGGRLHRRLDRRRDARPGARPGRLRAGARVRQLPLVHRRRRLHRHAAFQPDSALTAIVLGFSLLPAVLILASLVVPVALPARRRRPSVEHAKESA